jgi:cytochrome c553
MRGLLVGALLCASTVAAADVDDAGYHALQRLLAHNPGTGAPVDSVDELLPLLERDLRDNFTLVYATRSPQRDVDPLHPRAVLYRPDGRLVVAFTGDPAGASRDVLDVMHFSDTTRAFELERFVLPAAARRDPALAALARGNGEANPSECRRCHGADPRPIFESYFVWPGFYGSIRDRLLAGSAELATYRAFLAAKDAPTSIYRWLRFAPGSQVSPYAFEPTASEAVEFAPNMRLGMALTELNRKRIARTLEASPVFPIYRDKLLTALLGCAAMPVGGAARARVRAAVDAENAAKLDRAGVTDPALRGGLRMAELNSVANLADLDYLARVLDVSRADWSMALETGAWSLFDGILSGMVGKRDFYFKEDVLLELLPAAATNRYALYGRLGARLDLPPAIAGCGELLARSSAVPWPTLPASAPAVVYRCTRCHEPGGEGPPIPFDSPRRLRLLIAEQPDLPASIASHIADDGEHRMPLDAPALSDADRSELLAYITVR